MVQVYPLHNGDEDKIQISYPLGIKNRDKYGFLILEGTGRRTSTVKPTLVSPVAIPM